MGFWFVDETQGTLNPQSKPTTNKRGFLKKLGGHQKIQTSKEERDELL